MKRDCSIDLTEVKPIHLVIHDRLLNWARWCRGGNGGTAMQPMFRGFRAGYEEPPVVAVPIDSLDGHRVEKLVVGLPEKHRTILQWAYVRPYIPVRRVCQVLAIPYRELPSMLHDARAMVRNRA
jgi:DNA-directed RNA polymerase specialized sigma24 family protein